MADTDRLLTNAAERLARSVGIGLALARGIARPCRPGRASRHPRSSPRIGARAGGWSTLSWSGSASDTTSRRWAGPRVDTVSELVLTILSQNTADVNSFHAFTALRAAYASWPEVLAAPTDELEEVLRPGGLAPTKSRRIQAVLAEVERATAAAGTSPSWGSGRSRRRGSG